jgi:aconitate hydratase
MYLGVRAVLAKSVERIHLANLINFGIMPLIFTNGEQYETLQPGDELTIDDVHDQLRKGKLIVKNKTQGNEFTVSHNLTPRQVEIVLHGGLLNYTGKN